MRGEPSFAGCYGPKDSGDGKTSRATSRPAGQEQLGGLIKVLFCRSGEGSSGKRPLPDGRRQVSGGWNRVHLEVTDLAAEVERLPAMGVSFRTNDIVTGPGGAQVILDDPSGNPVELFQPRR